MPTSPRWLVEADLVIEGHRLATDTGERLDVAPLREAIPSLVALSITPDGLSGPWPERPATEFSLQVESGSLGIRGLMGQQRFQAGRRINDRGAAAYGAAAALASRFGAHDRTW